MFERFTDQARQVVRAARAEADRLRHPRAGAEHLLVALLAHENDLCVRVLRDAGADLADLRSRAADAARAAEPTTVPLGEADAAALREIGIDLDSVRAAVERTFGAGALRPPEPARRPWWRRTAGGTFTPQARKILELSLREALRLRHRHIGTEHLLLGLLRDGRGPAVAAIMAAGVDPDTVDHWVRNALRPAA
ncbi:Clp protease N-terminal domain-containing protein [Solwaraspora sp. WMMD406]|uniref:Clp protease N-terminal domain-containing protein n=1 Tax=Solwaraspora sp. WMMD406 TaxID=3016095 RepID=UPI0024162F49|nr:Clp protease N-terminal domain-containing protein [Solwaraspora sp. WMMD406]MDG4766838.1 Clp protease N-terminal domain-containing protein [Solwaraspora sp. WMMD406]